MYLLKTDWALHMITVNDEMLSVLELCTHLASQVLINEMVHATADFEVANTCQEDGTHLKHHLTVHVTITWITCMENITHQVWSPSRTC